MSKINSNKKYENIRKKYKHNEDVYKLKRMVCDFISGKDFVSVQELTDMIKERCDQIIECGKGSDVTVSTIKITPDGDYNEDKSGWVELKVKSEDEIDWVIKIRISEAINAFTKEPVHKFYCYSHSDRHTIESIHNINFDGVHKNIMEENIELGVDIMFNKINWHSEFGYDYSGDIKYEFNSTKPNDYESKISGELIELDYHGKLRISDIFEFNTNIKKLNNCNDTKDMFEELYGKECSIDWVEYKL